MSRDYQGKRVNPHIGPLAKVIRLKLFLDIVPSSFADITRALRGCFNLQLREDVFFDILITSKGASPLGIL